MIMNIMMMMMIIIIIIIIILVTIINIIIIITVCEDFKYVEIKIEKDGRQENFIENGLIKAE